MSNDNFVHPKNISDFIKSNSRCDMIKVKVKEHEAKEATEKPILGSGGDLPPLNVPPELHSPELDSVMEEFFSKHANPEELMSDDVAEIEYQAIGGDPKKILKANGLYVAPRRGAGYTRPSTDKKTRTKKRKAAKKSRKHSR